ncbi:unnamed protein product [Leuciscus chuanchicus]
MRNAVIFVLLSALTPVALSLHHDFIFVPLTVNWSEAQTYCRQHYTDLATVNDKEDNDNLLKVLANCVRPTEKKRQIVRLEVKSGQDLNDPEVKKEILAKMEQILKEKGLAGEAKLSWRTQSDGNVFQTKDRKSCQTCL